jgi:hypothetical protein
MSLLLSVRLLSVRLIFFVWLSGSLAFPRALTAECVPKPNSGKSEVFSSVTTVKAPDATIHPDDLVSGVELVLEEHSDHVSATLRDYEGRSTPLVAKLQGALFESVTGCNVRLSGHNKRGIVEIEGIIGAASFHGTITRKIGREVYLEEVSLRRKPAETENHVGSQLLRGRCLRSEVSHDDFASLQFSAITCQPRAAIWSLKLMPRVLF